MQISPRYDGPPTLRVDAPVGDPSIPMVRQRRRFADFLGTLGKRQWAAETRCDGWSVQDVVMHLITTNQFWTMSITSGLAGEPTRFLATFDPVQTPAQIVDGMRDMTPADVLVRYSETTDALAAAVDGLDDHAWSAIAEAPPGHVAIRSLALHALWDAWIHERDVLLPLGIEQVLEPDEISGSLLYAAALGPALNASTGSERRGTLSVAATDPDVSFVVESGPTVVVRTGPAPDDAPCLTGDAVTLVEGLSFRGPLDHGLDDDDIWLLGGLAAVFDVASGSH